MCRFASGADFGLVWVLLMVDCLLLLAGWIGFVFCLCLIDLSGRLWC